MVERVADGAEDEDDPGALVILFVAGVLRVVDELQHLDDVHRGDRPLLDVQEPSGLALRLGGGAEEAGEGEHRDQERAHGVYLATHGSHLRDIERVHHAGLLAQCNVPV